MDVTFVGLATWDTVVQLPHLPDADGRVVAEALCTAGGGPAATGAVATARLGLRASLVAAVGTDPEAELIRADLAAEGVGTEGVAALPDHTSGACVVLVDRPRASRAICVRPGPGLRLEPGTAAAEAILTARLVHVDHVGLPAVEDLLETQPKTAPRPLISYDAGNLGPRRCPEIVDVYVPTLAALREVYADRADGEDPLALLAAARADGARLVVATDGPNGAYAAGPGGNYHVPGHRYVTVRSTLGAGDVFHGALVAALARDRALPDALAYANAAAALSCRGLDGRSGIPGDAETQELAARVPAAALAPAVR
ncbi:carbohydrate kinase family protein [Streptomyces rapamycinicus]|uniref:Carbohydrate kinase PfkB domain-containing protein n=2 Tax=Streptomyces rapamycinicus TaxID=1226757 RepID=A0A0A0NS87_STRRN|nr:PfkB family carbohydrate kinase [Streptomyces rapamycinicus]AGP59218.1 hypothetical protein M271_39165 [Streptomyces rapamycinicus NRRL 5491]MBB4786963.1 sugar/nucleoside kinase (ribokinase family) [Streptomyces rapamycinicus]RLV77585.1 hypothetical protein D3C57_104410 [Streptomyces rapamycinicus NRRL 5491]UTO66975.1 PfkB family carbohydrate kinase [Streptomyces rapamycinicus]UTP34932.1 PfkB family carbohydrate kinase [Streptomyces rapamycinicus NRRL 5491]